MQGEEEPIMSMDTSLVHLLRPERQMMLRVLEEQRLTVADILAHAA